MAKKKSSRKAKAKPSKGRPKNEHEPVLPDRRTIEGLMHGLFQGHGEGQTPLDQAQQLMYTAFDLDSDQRVALAREALEISPDCADAYVALAEEAQTADEALELYRRGVAAGERALGKKAFKQYRGQFWGFLETRPYMRARLGLAQTLWDVGQRDEAVELYQDLLRLNPNDNQGVRYLLAGALLDLNRNQELERLLEDYDEDGSAVWNFSRALLAFRQEGDTPHARQLLTEAQTANPYVPDYLTGQKPMPMDLPLYIGRGDEDEAMAYAADFRTNWRSTPGALAWMRKILKLPFGPEPEPHRPSWRQVKIRLQQLPQSDDEVWEVDARQSDVTYEAEEGSFRPWILLVTNRTEDTVLEFEVGESRPSASDVWEYLIDAMIDPRDGEPHRPTRIEVRLKTFQKAWSTKLQQVDIACELSDELEHVEEILARIPSHPGEHSEPMTVEPGELANLPQEPGETWQADVRRLPTWLDQEGEATRPWTAMVVDRDHNLILANEMTPNTPTADWLWEGIMRAIQQPTIGEPHRPSTIEVRATMVDSLRPRLEAIGIECVVRDDLDRLGHVLDDLNQHMAGGELLRGLLDVPGMTVEQVGSFFAAAADFYRRAPWRDIAWDAAIKIECDKFQSGPWYALVMGQSGMVLGIALYEDLQVLDATLDNSGEEDVLRRTSAISVLFGEAFEMPFADLDAIDEHPWPIAAPEAYPHAYRINPGLAVRPLLPWELELLEAVLRAIPKFLADDSPEQAVAVQTGAGPLQIRLAWRKSQDR